MTIPEMTIPGRGDVRITLTSACNLKCSYCHNEGQRKPWERLPIRITLPMIENLLEKAHSYGAKSIKFTGGDPGSYSEIISLLETVDTWRGKFPGIQKWGIATNGIPFMSPSRFRALSNSGLDNISIGVDALGPKILTKPSSSTGVTGNVLLNRFIIPLIDKWKPKGKFIKIDTVFTGDNKMTTKVIDTSLGLGIGVSVIEQNGIMGNISTTRLGFKQLIASTAERLGLETRLYTPLNETYLYNTNGDAVVKFYQDHCADLDCDSCRKIHLRVIPTADGWGAVPCFLQAQEKVIPLGKDVDHSKIEDSIKYNGKGSEWFKGTRYE
jgi:molybdenum cofactor biosynthesis enzyme MoaA